MEIIIILSMLNLLVGIVVMGIRNDKQIMEESD